MFEDVQTKEKQHLSLMYAMYSNDSNDTPSSTHVSLYMVLKRSLGKSPTSVGYYTESHVILNKSALRKLYFIQWDILWCAS